MVSSGPVPTQGGGGRGRARMGGVGKEGSERQSRETKTREDQGGEGGEKKKKDRGREKGWETERCQSFKTAPNKESQLAPRFKL